MQLLFSIRNGIVDIAPQVLSKARAITTDIYSNIDRGNRDLIVGITAIMQSNVVKTLFLPCKPKMR